MGGWHWNRSNLSGIEDALIVEPSDPEPRGGLPAIPPAHKPRANAPDEQQVIPLYQQSEGAIFNLGLKLAPYRYLDVTEGDGEVLGEQDVRTAAWWCIYLHGILNEDRRPKAWLDVAETKLRELADFLLGHQLGSEHADDDVTESIGTSGENDLEYGGFVTLVSDSAEELLGSVYSEDVGLGGLALLRAYQTLGDLKYRAGYLAALTCLRRMQCGGKLTTRYATQTLSGEGRLNTGMWSHKLDITDLSARGAIDNSCVDATVGGQYSMISMGAGAHYGVDHDSRFIETLNGDPANTELDVAEFPIDLRSIGGSRLKITFMGIFASEPLTGTLTWRLRLLDDPSSTTVSSGTAIATLREVNPSSSEQILTDTSDIANPGIMTAIRVTVETSATNNSDAYMDGWLLTLEAY
jgi:hypothetical protein